MGKSLTPKEWKTQGTPIYWRRVPPAFRWQILEFGIASKWLDDNCEGWYYLEDHTFLFGSHHDAAMFEIWLRPNILGNQQGHI